MLLFAVNVIFVRQESSRMNILIFIDSVIPVTAYGGTQRVMWSLARELAGMGHDVRFLARQGSFCDFARVIVFDPSRTVASQVPEDTDIVHFNDKVPENVGKPYIVTYHGNFLKGELDRNAVFVSSDHARRYGSSSFVYNGLDWNGYGKADLNASRMWYHFLGKAAWRVKNVKGAIDVVRALPGERLYVLGGSRFNLKMGLRLTLTPKARFRGMVEGEEKEHYLRHSKGLVFPVRWDEPFGLAIIESLYFGAPVFGTPYGSLPELVIPEVGFLTRSKDEMVGFLRDGRRFRPETCHEYARDRFNSKVMAEAYLRKYETVLNGRFLNAVRPHACAEDSKRKEWR